ncbi:(2Fe-2S)-binding protein [Ruminococcus sp. YE282]
MSKYHREPLRSCCLYYRSNLPQAHLCGCKNTSDQNHFLKEILPKE